MRLVVDKYNILTDKELEKPIKIILISDIHVENKLTYSGKRNMKDVVRYVRKLGGVDFFAFCGDYVKGAKNWLDPVVWERVCYFIQELAKIAPVVMVKGNHDIYYKSSRTEAKYSELSKIENVFLLDEKQKTFSGIRVTGFTPRHEAYNPTNHGKKSNYLMAEDFRNCGFKFNPEKFNLILTHSPFALTNKVTMDRFPEFYKNSDLILSGHIHNGLIYSRNFEFVKNIVNNPKKKKYLRNISDLGIWPSFKTGFFIKNCRGARFVGDGKNENAILPSSKKFVSIAIRKKSKKLIQIVGKGINKYPFLPFFDGKPSICEIKISQKNFDN